MKHNHDFDPVKGWRAGASPAYLNCACRNFDVRSDHPPL